MAPTIQIKKMTLDSVNGLYTLAEQGQHDVDLGYFEAALAEQECGKRTVLVAYAGPEMAGYVHLNRQPKYVPFRRFDIPEIQDLYVAPTFRRLGIGESLITACENLAESENAEDIGIGVGVAGNFGTAQRLYIRLGYVPDGLGVVFEREPLSVGEVRPVDDRLCLMLMKSLKYKP